MFNIKQLPASQILNSLNRVKLCPFELFNFDYKFLKEELHSICCVPKC